MGLHCSYYGLQTQKSFVCFIQGFYCQRKTPLREVHTSFTVLAVERTKIEVQFPVHI